MPFPERIETRQGLSFYVSDQGDLQVLKEIFDEPTYNVDVKPGMMVLDIGANKGIFSIWAASKGARVISYEPNTTTFQTFLRNMDLNSNVSNSISPFCRGVWSSNTTRQLYPNTWNSGASSFFPETGNEWMEEPYVVSLEEFDDILLSASEWDIVKIDTEGAEFEILSTSRRLNRVKFITIERHYWEGWKELDRYEEMIANLRKTFHLDAFWETLPEKRSELKRGGMIYGRRRDEVSP